MSQDDDKLSNNARDASAAGCTTSRSVRSWRPDPGVHDIAGQLRRSGLRPTQQRLSLARLLFSQGGRHVSAEMLHAEARGARIPVSLATVYNTLNQFTEAGLLRELSVDGARAFFDTNTSEHHHFLVEGGDVFDVPAGMIEIGALPEPPEGMEIVRVEVVVRLRKKPRRASIRL